MESQPPGLCSLPWPSSLTGLGLGPPLLTVPWRRVPEGQAQQVPDVLAASW